MVFIIKIISGFFASLTGVCATMYFYKKAESFDVKNNIKLLLFGAGLVAHVFLELSDFNNKDIAIKIIIIIISLAAALAYGHFVSKIYLYSIFIQNKAFDYIPDYDFNKVEEEVKRMTNTTINGQKFNLKGRKSKKWNLNI